MPGFRAWRGWAPPLICRRIRWPAPKRWAVAPMGTVTRTGSFSVVRSWARPSQTLVERPWGPNALAFLERALAALRPIGPDGAARLEVFAQLTAFVAGHVAHEVARAEAAQSPDRAAAESLYLAAVAADGHHPEPAEALATAGRPLTPDATFTRFLNRLVDGLDAG